MPPTRPQNAAEARPRACHVGRHVPCFEVSWRAISVPVRWREASSLAMRGNGGRLFGLSCCGGASLPARSGPQRRSGSELLARFGQTTTDVCGANVRAPELQRRPRTLAPWRGQKSPHDRRRRLEQSPAVAVRSATPSRCLTTAGGARRASAHRTHADAGTPQRPAQVRANRESGHPSQCRQPGRAR